ncbi:hypothetical protein MNBD_NITROSPINAE04-60, partial [hydrothermal vent metagenome]
GQNVGSPQDTFTGSYNPAEVLSQPKTQGDSMSVVYGNVSLDLYASRSESLTTQYTSQGPDGYRSFRQELGRRFESSLSLDFSFLAKVDGAAQKLAELDSSLLDKWMAEASDLLNLREKDFQEFVIATDELFNELEKALGMGPEGLNYVSDFFTSEVDKFLDSVKENVQYFEKNPLGEGEDLGLGIPGIKDSVTKNIPDNFKAFLEKLMEQLNAEEFNGIDSLGSLLKSLDELYSEMLERFNEQIDNPENNRGNNRKESGNSSEKDSADQSSNNQFAFQSYEYYYERVITVSALLQYSAQEPAPAQVDISQPPPVDVTT